MYYFPERDGDNETDKRDRSDSPHAFITAVLKEFPQFTYDFIMNGISTINLMALMNSIPRYRGIESKEGNKGKHKSKNRGGTTNEKGEYIPIDRSKAKAISWGDLNI